MKKIIALLLILMLSLATLTACSGDDNSCWVCNGTGYESKKTCPACHGTGKLYD